uniref:Uncharacterized protein n=1 Tax=Pundamilia nyererei TaxID=303518 RepID=A0A3B4F6P7_9CICH
GDPLHSSDEVRQRKMSGIGPMALYQNEHTLNKPRLAAKSNLLQRYKHHLRKQPLFPRQSLTQYITGLLRWLQAYLSCTKHAQSKERSVCVFAI